VEVEQDGFRLLLDLGLPIDASTNSQQQLPPGVHGLDGSDSALLGIFITHPHLDHFGLLGYVSPTIPVGMGAAARRMLAAAAPFLPGDWPLPAPGWSYESRISMEVGPFRVTPILVDHSAFDAYALMVESGGKRLLYSGDFRAHGRKSALFDGLVANPPREIDALLVEGSSLGRLRDDQRFATESDVEQQLVTLFAETSGLALVHTSAQNIDRIVSIYRACKRTERKLVVDLYAAAILETTGHSHIPQSDWDDIALFVPQSQRLQVKKNAWFDLLKRHSTHRVFMEDLQATPEEFALLFRPLHQLDLEHANCLNGAAYVYSQWEGYWDGGTYDRAKDWLLGHNIAKHSIHTSGHASPVDLKVFVAAMAARQVVPIHSFMPEHYPTLFANVCPHADGQWWDV
jgi:ribonuclease J